MPRLDPVGERLPPDLLSGALLLGGLTPLILSLQIDKRRYPWLPGMPGSTASGLDAYATLGLFAFGVLTLGLFVRRTRRAASPILDFRLFQNAVFRTANLATFFYGAAFMSVTIFLPLFLVNVVAVSATRAGAALIPFSMGLVLSATLAGQFVAKVGYRRPIFGGGVLFLVSVILLATMSADVTYLRVTAYMVLAGLGVGPSMPLFTLAVQNAVDVRFIGQATSASQFFRQTGATVGAALMGTVLGTTLGIAFAAIELPPQVTSLPGTSAVEFVSTGGAGLSESVRQAFEVAAERASSPEDGAALRAEGNRRATEISSAVRDAFAAATRRIYWLTALFMVAGTTLCLRLPELPLRTTHDRVEAMGASGDGPPAT
jgi:MFS family permease